MSMTTARFREAAGVVYVLCETTMESMAGVGPSGAAQPIIDGLPEPDVREALACLVGLYTASVIALGGEGAEHLLRRMTIETEG